MFYILNFYLCIIYIIIQVGLTFYNNSDVLNNLGEKSTYSYNFNILLAFTFEARQDCISVVDIR